MRAALSFLLYFATLFVMPLLGAALSGQPVAPLLRFPPRTELMEPAPFSWTVFCVAALLILACLAPPLWRITAARSDTGSARQRHPFPSFGAFSLGLLGIAWLLAWNRFPWAAPAQRYTFTPLWLAYIGLINALTVVRSGRSPLTSETRRFALLFPLSLIFWWGFEYLNRYVRNWHYLEINDLSATAYTLEASLSFSTVLPAIYCTAVWLQTYPGLAAGLDRCTALRPVPLRASTAAIVGCAAILLAITAIWPAELFPSIWIAPLLLMTGLQHLISGTSVLHRAFSSGDFRESWSYALAGLVCGIFWELWNFYSLAHWEYQIPYVGRFPIFAMPLLGYAGYLPFGILCALAIDGVHPAAGGNAQAPTFPHGLPGRSKPR